MTKYLLVAVAALGLWSCGQAKDVDKLGDAQLCLDGLASNAVPSQVDDCLSKISGLSSTNSYNLRCAGSFMKEGFLNPSKIVNAMDQINTNNNTASFMSLITFTSAHSVATDTADSYTAFNYCLQGQGKGATLFASFGYVAMSLYQYMNAADPGSCSNTPGATGYPFDTCAVAYASNIANLASLANLTNAGTGNAAAQAVQSSIGTVLIATYTLSCTGAVGNTQLCTQIGTAITAAGGTSNARSVATNFFTSLL